MGELRERQFDQDRENDNGPSIAVSMAVDEVQYFY
jgi:hypothetical protein